MKEPWKKTCNGKVIITLNDEKTEPSEVEVPVDLNWTNRSEKKCRGSKVLVLVGVVLLLGLTLVTLFKVQNLIYSTSYINWRVQELESAINDSSDDVKLIKYRLSMEEKDDEMASIRAARAEPLIASAKGPNGQFDANDLKLSESQNQKHKLTANLVPESDESKKEENTESKAIQTEAKDSKEVDDLNDARDHPNPSDSDDWIKPLVESFDIFGNQPIEDGLINNVLMKLLMPEKDFEVVELNKMQDSENSAQEPEAPRISIFPLMRKFGGRSEKSDQLTRTEMDLLKAFGPPSGNFRVFHLNEKSEPKSLAQIQDEIIPKLLNFKPSTPEIMEHTLKSLFGSQKFSRLFGKPEQANQAAKLNGRLFNDKLEQQQNSAEEDMPKITIQSIKLKLLPLPAQEDFSQRREPMNMNNFEVIRLNESPEPSQDVEAPRAPMPIPMGFRPFHQIPLHDILMKTIIPLDAKNVEFVNLNEKSENLQPIQMNQEQQPMLRPSPIRPAQNPQDDMGMYPPEQRFNPIRIPFEDIIGKALMPPSRNAESQFHIEQQEQQNPVVKVQNAMKPLPFPLPIPDALMKSMLPNEHFGRGHLVPSVLRPVAPEDMAQAEQPQMQPEEHESEQAQAPQEQTPAPEEAQKNSMRSTKLNPIADESTWDRTMQY
ncbi:uncharacterized protein LOC106660418 [Trichogramma pretiosum]|uniref:uncharacterized protein LOC106660418 n=1 Tax=Trichogramma pretiosum TaxID=7493 RepID=UPI0006C998C5|nr:uncharacterized protein LOC106660418 [Trichogramma pretiosum]